MKARIRDGAFIGCDMHFCKWKDDGEVFEVGDFNNVPPSPERKYLVAPGYGGNPYGAGGLYVNVADLIEVEDVSNTGISEHHIVGAINWCQWCHAQNPDIPEDCRYCFTTTSLPEVKIADGSV